MSDERKDADLRTAIVLAWNRGFMEGAADGAPYPSESEIADIIEAAKPKDGR